VVLRQRLRDTEARLRLLAAATLADIEAAQSLAALVLSGKLDSDGESLRPPSNLSGEPVARSIQDQE